MNQDSYDLAIIGGGINGAGVAADAAGRGLSVVLIEKNDLASGTSSASSKLVHGGLRYLEQFEFALVRQSLAEREVLLQKAPHIVWPLRFVIPPHRYARSQFILRTGLFLYDHLSHRVTLGRSARIDLERDGAGAALANRQGSALTYWDCWVDDARLVVLNARHAADLGAHILTRSACVAAQPGSASDSSSWLLTIESEQQRRTIAARAVVNTAGPAAGDVARLRTPSRNDGTVKTRLVKGSHIVIRRKLAGGSAFLMQNNDGRVVFALPFEEDFTLIGTTDQPYETVEGQPEPSRGEIEYLCTVASSYLKQPVGAEGIVWSFAGVRALYDDGHANPSQVTRDYRIIVSQSTPAWIDVVGGKITTYRRLAEAVMSELAMTFPRLAEPWTHCAVLPGGDFDGGECSALLAKYMREFPSAGAAYVQRLIRRYGTLSNEILGDASTAGAPQWIVTGHLTRGEVSYLARREWARTAEDVLWRRTKAGLHVAPGDIARVTDAIDDALGGQ